MELHFGLESGGLILAQDAERLYLATTLKVELTSEEASAYVELVDAIVQEWRQGREDESENVEIVVKKEHLRGWFGHKSRPFVLLGVAIPEGGGDVWNSPARVIAEEVAAFVRESLRIMDDSEKMRGAP